MPPSLVVLAAAPWRRELLQFVAWPLFRRSHRQSQQHPRWARLQGCCRFETIGLFRARKLHHTLASHTFDTLRSLSIGTRNEK